MLLGQNKTHNITTFDILHRQAFSLAGDTCYVRDLNVNFGVILTFSVPTGSGTLPSLRSAGKKPPELGVNKHGSCVSRLENIRSLAAKQQVFVCLFYVDTGGSFICSFCCFCEVIENAFV